MLLGSQTQKDKFKHKWLKQICWELQGLEIGIQFNPVIATEKLIPATHDSKEYEILLQMNTTNSHQTQLFENQGELHDLFKMIAKYAVLLFPYAYYIVKLSPKTLVKYGKPWSLIE